MSAVLMDTHALIWFANGDAISRPALDAILAGIHVRTWADPIYFPCPSTCSAQLLAPLTPLRKGSTARAQAGDVKPS